MSFKQPQKNPIHVTIEDIRKIPGKENLSDEQAQRMLFAVRQFAALIYDCFTQTKNHEGN